MKLLRAIYTFALISAVAFAVWCAASGAWLQTDLNALLPEEKRPDVLLLKADEAAEKQLNGQLVAMTGHDEAEAAFQTASALAQLWRESGLFARVDSEIRPDLAALQQDGARFGMAFMPSEQRALLLERPQDYFRERAEAAVNPFAGPSLLPLEQDWLGFGRYLNRSAESAGGLQWNEANGMLYAEDGGKTWVLLRGVFSDGRQGDAAAVQRLADSSRAQAASSGGSLLMGGGALFAAAAKIQAERESSLMGAAGLLLTFAFLLRLFRSKRIFWLLLPLAAGLAAGLAAVLAVFGEIHILTVVIGTSLIGLLVDFPLHWLTPARFIRRNEKWQAAQAARAVLPVFAVSLLITVSGYALLWLTPLPVLRQTALFSAFALIAAFGATVLWLPKLFRDYHGRYSRRAESVQNRFLPSKPVGRFSDGRKRQQGRLKKGLAAVALLLVLIGLFRSQWHDDIRAWVAVQPELLRETQEIGRLAGVSFGTQSVLAEAASEDGLLLKSREAAQRLQLLQEQGALDGFEALGGQFATLAEQRELQTHLAGLADKPKEWQALRAVGVPRKTVREALISASESAPVPLSDGLAHPLAEAWRPLYLGEVEKGRFAALIRLHGVHDAAAVQAALVGAEGLHWADKRAHLNELFLDTRNQAAWLKLLSFALAWLVLWRLGGARRATQIMAVPLAAAVVTVSLLGWFGVPVSLFAMFGLLLVSAVGIDYAVYALSEKHSAAARFGGMAAAALTTGISFTLLAFSSTPAVASFGLTVAAGTFWNMLFAVWLLKRKSRNEMLS
ncbi:MAG: hypothetical protein Q4D82_00475 [Neisseria sp.]|nr:hypothetical protein [Neisseria sp.]